MLSLNTQLKRQKKQQEAFAISSNLIESFFLVWGGCDKKCRFTFIVACSCLVTANAVSVFFLNVSCFCWSPYYYVFCWADRERYFSDVVKGRLPYYRTSDNYYLLKFQNIPPTHIVLALTLLYSVLYCFPVLKYCNFCPILILAAWFVALSLTGNYFCLYGIISSYSLFLYACDAFLIVVTHFH